MKRATGQEHTRAQVPTAGRRWHVLLLFGLPLMWACTRSEEDRRALFEEAERVNAEIFAGAVVRDLRAPTDTGRLTYDSPVSLHLRRAMAEGAAQVWAPFGIAEPDTIR